MKQIDGKARRVQKYDRMFFWYVPACAAFIGWLGYAGAPSAWVQVSLGVAAGVLVGGVLGVLLRDVP